MDRRQIITGLVALVAAPSIVRASSLMTVRAYASDYEGIDLSEYTYDGFNYVDAAGGKYCVSPVGRISIKIRNGVVVENNYKPGGDLYKLGDFQKAFFSGDWSSFNSGPVKVGELSEKSYRLYKDNLSASLSAYRSDE